MVGASSSPGRHAFLFGPDGSQFFLLFPFHRCTFKGHFTLHDFFVFDVFPFEFFFAFLREHATGLGHPRPSGGHMSTTRGCRADRRGRRSENEHGEDQSRQRHRERLSPSSPHPLLLLALESMLQHPDGPVATASGQGPQRAGEPARGP